MISFPYEYVLPEPNSGCWLWTGPLNWNGYGRVTVGPRKRVRAHRFSYEVHKGPIPDGLQVLHKCDVPCCVNPEHLLLGTFADNMNDKMRKGRQARGAKLSAVRKATVPLGQANHASRLTEVQVRAIIADARSGRLIARDYGTTQQHISRLKRGLRWGHLKNEART